MTIAHSAESPTVQSLTAEEIEAVSGGVPFLFGMVIAAGTGGGLAALALAIEDVLGYHQHY